jgi:hypothetical protein
MLPLNPKLDDSCTLYPLGGCTVVDIGLQMVGRKKREGEGRGEDDEREGRGSVTNSDTG